METTIALIATVLENLKDPAAIERVIGTLEEWHNSRIRVGLACTAMSEGLYAMATGKKFYDEMPRHRLDILHAIADNIGYISQESVTDWEFEQQNAS